MKKHFKTLIKVLVSSGLIFFVLNTVDLNELGKSIRSFNYIYGLIALLLVCLNYWMSSVRWKALLIYENCENITVSYLTRLYFIGSFFNNFMPTSIGGDAYKIYKLSKSIRSVENAFSATFMERFTGMIALIFISVFGMFGVFLFEQAQLKGFDGLWVVLLLLGAFLLILLFGFYFGLWMLNFLRKKVNRFEKIYSSLVAYRGKNRVLLYAFGTSFLVQLFSIFTQYFVFLGLGVTLDLFRVFFLLPVIILAGFFIPSLNGIGVQDYLYKVSNTFLGVTPEVALSASVLYHFVRLFVSLFGGVFYVLEKSDQQA